MGFAKKLLAVALAFSFLLFVPGPSGASYRISLTGAVDFQAEPWTPANFTGYVVVGLGAESQSQLDISLAVSGEVAQWLTWTDASDFTIYPDQQVFVHFRIDFPAMAPDEYDGLISANGVPTPGAQTGGAAVPGNVAVAVGVSVNVPAQLFLQDPYADGVGAAVTVANFLNATFNGSVEFILSRVAGWVETQSVALTNMSVNSTALAAVTWNSAPALGVVYTVTIRLRDQNGTLRDEEAVGFRLPTPADIINTWHLPGIVYEDYDAEIFATVHDPQGGATECTCHFTVDGSAEQAGLMDYDAIAGNYRFIIDNTSYHVGDVVGYRVTSENNASGTLYQGASDLRTFRVYSSTAPDLVIDAGSFQFIPIDPGNRTMYDANTTNVYVTVRNMGRGNAADVIVQFIDEYNGTVAFTNFRTLASVASLSLDTATFGWNHPVAGAHSLRFVVDPDDNVTETNEDNNYFGFDITVAHAEAEEPEPEPEEDVWGLVPFIVIPLIILLVLLLLLLFFRKGGIRVRVLEVKEYTRTRDGAKIWRYVCGYGEDGTIGQTKSTDVKAGEGDTILVQPKNLTVDKDGSVGWTEAKVLKVVAEPPDTEGQLRKRVKK